MEHANLSIRDIKYIAKKANLSPKKAKSLMETKHDFYLLLEAICDECYPSRSKISTNLKNKILFFKTVKEFDLSNMDIEDKSYMLKLLSYYVPRIKKKINTKIALSNKSNEQTARYNFILYTCFPSTIKDLATDRNYVKFIIDGFKNSQKTRIYLSIRDWIKVFKKIHEKSLTLS